MLSIPQYLIESSICLIVFYGFYHFLLKKETFFQLNRFYLLATPFLSLLIPFWNISLKKEEVAATAFDTVIYPAIQSAQQVQAVFWEQMREPTPVFSLSVADVIMAIYLGGALLMGFTLLRSLWRLNRLIRKGKRQRREGFTQVELQDSFPAASFFGYIFYNQQITDEQQLILEHEKVHIRQWHSLDVLAMELVVIIKWFNPLIYFFRNALKATHEFIADQYVIQQKTNRTTYAFLLVNASKIATTPLTNTFYSLTKERLKMMLQQPSENWKMVKYLMVIPTVLVLMSLFSFNLLEEFQTVRAGLEEMDTAFSEIGGKTVFEMELPEKKHSNDLSAYTIKWGEIELPFYPPDPDGRVVYPHEAIQKQEFLSAIHHHIYVWKNNQKLSDVEAVELEVFSATVDGKTINVGQSRMWFRLEPNVVPIELMNNMPSFEKLGLEDLLISISVPSLGLKSSLQVGEGATNWNIPVQVNTEPQQHFPYQVILSDKERTRLKIDTTLNSNKEIIQLYRNPSKYQILHIPNFKTKTRLLKIEELNSGLSTGPPTDKIFLPEYLDFDPKELHLSFGKIKASPIDSCKINNFEISHQQPLTLTLNNQLLTIKRFQLAVFEKQKGWKNLEIQNWQAESTQDFLNDLSSESSVYFTKIIMEKDGQEYYLPQTFLVTIEKEEEDTGTGYRVNKTTTPVALASLPTPKKEKNNYQIQWGKYIFNCEVNMNSRRRQCNCEGKFIAKNDLKTMNRSGIRFFKDGKKVGFKNIDVSIKDGHVYCIKEDLMMQSDQQKNYNKKACIWNAFKEEDKGSVSFQTEEFARVRFNFSINSSLANTTILPIQVVMGSQTFPLDYSKNIEDKSITLNQAIQLLDKDAYIQYYDKQYPIQEIKVSHFAGHKSKKYTLSNKDDLQFLKSKIQEDQELMMTLGYTDEIENRKINGLMLFNLTSLKNEDHTLFKWGEHKISVKNRHLGLPKKELVSLLKDHTILNWSDEKFESIGNLHFQFRYRPNEMCTINGTWEEMKNDPCVAKNISYLQHGDLLHFNDLKRDLHRGWLTVLIQEKNYLQEDILIQQTLQSKQSMLYSFEANGQHLQKQNISLEALVKELTQIRHGKLKVEGKNLPNLDVFFHSNETGLSKEEIYARILEKLKSQYKIAIKTKYQEQTGWFLSGGDAQKLNQYTEEKVMPNLEYFNDQVRAKGQEPVGPMEYNWFADRYFDLEYGIKVTDLTEFSGRYILPLKTKSLKSLQKQLKKDYGLVLKEQKRTIPITVVRFE